MVNSMTVFICPTLDGKFDLKQYIIIIAYANRFITDFKEKAELFHSFFSEKCSLISNNSSLPSSISYTTEKRLSTVALSVEAIGKIIQNLDSNKADGHGNISVRMLKICGDSIYKPLEITFWIRFSSWRVTV